MIEMIMIITMIMMTIIMMMIISLMVMMIKNPEKVLKVPKLVMMKELLAPCRTLL